MILKSCFSTLEFFLLAESCPCFKILVYEEKEFKVDEE